MKLARLSLKNSEKLALISNLSTMLFAGISILHAVDSLSRNKKGNTKLVLDIIRQDLLAGKPLSISFAKFPRIFNKVTVNMVKAAEQAGTLDTTLKDVKIQLKKEMEFNGKIRGAMFYPVTVFVVFIAVLLLILVGVIPKISMVFTNMKIELPLPTKIMVFVSDILIHQTIIVIAVIALLVTGIVLLYRFKKEQVLAVLYSLPLISGLIREVDLMRFTRCMYLLLTSGIPITAALELTEEVVHKKEIAKGITFTKRTVLAGNTISTALKQHPKHFPEIMITLIETGEKTGTLDKAMQDISEYFDDRVSDSLKTIVTVMEPVMLVIVGILVGSLMFAIVGPIYGLIGQISPR